MKAAKNNHPKAMECVAYLYKKGCGTKKNDHIAARWYRSAQQYGSRLAEKKIKRYYTFRFFE